jgi:hypothetical protein
MQKSRRFEKKDAKRCRESELDVLCRCLADTVVTPECQVLRCLDPELVRLGGLRGYALQQTNSVSGPANVGLPTTGATGIVLKAFRVNGRLLYQFRRLDLVLIFAMIQHDSGELAS